VSELVDEVTSEMLKDEIGAVIRDWGNEILLADHDGINNGWLQPYLVLSFCRMLHSLTTGIIESKAAGARWALTALDARWHGLIEVLIDEGDVIVWRAEITDPWNVDRPWTWADEWFAHDSRKGTFDPWVSRSP
jgi:hypothetical protein